MNDVLVIIPTYNERESVVSVLERLRSSTHSVDVLVIDDNSPDGTGAIVDDYRRQFPELYVIHRHSKDGLGRAYIAGFEWAFTRGYTWIVEMDADGSHDPAVVPTMVEIARTTGAELVIGSRWIRGGAVEGWNPFRQFLSRIGNAYARVALGSRVRDLTAGFRVLRTDALRALRLDTISSSGYCFQIEIAHRIEREGGTVLEHPIRFVEREYGRSKMHIGIVAEALFRISDWGIRRLTERNTL